MKVNKYYILFNKSNETEVDQSTINFLNILSAILTWPVIVFRFTPTSLPLFKYFPYFYLIMFIPRLSLS